METVTISVTVCLCYVFRNCSTPWSRAISCTLFSKNRLHFPPKHTFLKNFSYKWLIPAISGLLSALLLSSCITTAKSTSNDNFDKRYKGFEYCKIDAVKQSRQLSCGAAALTSVLNYWKEDSAPLYTEKDLITAHRSRGVDGYPLLQLREIALQQRFAAFAVTMSNDPLKKLTEHVSAGRPVIVACELPRGKYFGKSLPLIETLDRRAMWASDKEWKRHYLVVIGHSYNEILVMDPQYGIVRLPRDQFLHFWKQEKYAALIVSTLG